MEPDTDLTIEPQLSLIEVSAADRFLAAQEAFSAQLNSDFPDFSVEQYAAEKIAAEGIDREALSSRLWSEVRSMPGRLDLNGDGKFGLDDAEAAAKLAAGHLGESWEKISAIDKDDIKEAASTVRDAAKEAGRRSFGFDYSGTVKRAARKAKESVQGVDADTFRTSGHTITKLGKTAFGIQGIQNRKEGLSLKEISEEYLRAAEALTEERRIELNAHIEEFGALRLEALHETLGRFLAILKALQQQNRVKEYELHDGLGIDTQTLEAMGALDMTVTESLRTTATTGALGLAAVLGTPPLVIGAVGALATASTGTAISTLSGAASANAIMAWLGGGSLAAGGGGMAAGSVVLVGITAGATAGVTLLAAGILVSTHYAKKLSEAKIYQKDVALAVASLENAWLVMGGITSRVDELSVVTVDLRERLIPLLDQLEDLVPVFDATQESHAVVFNQCGLLVKTMVELAQVPLLGDDGDLTDESLSVTVKVKKILNREV